MFFLVCWKSRATSLVKSQEQSLLAAQHTTWLKLPFCRTLFILTFCCRRLVLSHDLFTCLLVWTQWYCIPHGFFQFKVAPECVFAFLFAQWFSMPLTVVLPSGHSSCSDSQPQLHLGWGIGFPSGLESPHLAAITGLFSLSLPDNDPYCKTPEAISTKIGQNKKAQKWGAVVRNWKAHMIQEDHLANSLCNWVSAATNLNSFPCHPVFVNAIRVLCMLWVFIITLRKTLCESVRLPGIALALAHSFPLCTVWHLWMYWFCLYLF